VSDSQVVVAAVSIGIFAATVAALLWYGPKAAMVVLLVAVIGLTLAVDSLFRRAEIAEGTADEALALGDNHTEEIVTLPTEPVTEVAARQVRALMQEGVEMVERTYVVDGVQRTFRLRAVKEDVA
jgi:urease gamma subunit